MTLTEVYSPNSTFNNLHNLFYQDRDEELEKEEEVEKDDKIDLESFNQYYNLK